MLTYIGIGKADPLASTQPQMRGHKVHVCAARLDSGRQCTTSFPSIDKQIETRHVDNRMSQQCIAGATSSTGCLLHW